ncbi:hypothetical protein EDB19DRAFT_1893122 [Suillus lakei]|nr:hypothetical protein EDB19DRAFT_1893122 [Suillus lakei]
MSVASESSETSVLEYIITHIFCPVKLPQRSDYTPDNDRSLLDVVLGSARIFVSYLPDNDQEQWNPSLKMLESLAVTMRSPSLTTDVVESQVKSMKAGDILAYLIREQNAAVVLRRLDTKTIFESFEVSPPASTVMAAKGKLLCSYPGPAIAVPNSVVDNPTFPPELVNFLSHMSCDVLDPTVLQGETAHPRYITQLLTDILRAFGEPADIPRIRKRISDDALQSNAALPWRRSSIWLVIRVVLQTSLERTSLGRNSYKAFMASLMTDLVSKALEGDMSSDLLYSMSTKISRRLVKIQAEDEFLAIAMHKATEDIKGRLELRWKNVQAAQVDSPHWDSSEIHMIRGTRLSLAESKEYIASVLDSPHVQSPVLDFQPHHRPRGTIDDFLGPDANFFESAYAENSFVALSDFECAIERDIDGWVNRVINLDAAYIDAACMTIQARAKSYSTRAQPSYSGNPENISIMLLTLFELWVALDKLVVKSIPLLVEYSPEVPVAIFNRLLLQKAAAIERLRVLQQYVAGRHTRDARSVFSDGEGMYMFATCKKRMEDDADAERKKRIADLRDKSDVYQRLTNEIDALTCWLQHDRGCGRCKKQQERDSLSVEAAVVVFELRAPIAFKMWRSFTFHFLHDICTPISQQIQSVPPSILLAHYAPLSCYHVEHPDQQPPRASRKSLPCSESDIFVNNINKLHFLLYDATRGVWASSSFRNTDISDICTHALPNGPYHELQYYLSGTQHTSNEVLANQAICHAELTLHEFIAFGSLRSGSLLQWINVLRELRARTLTFRDSAASWEVGELSADGSRAWHSELKASEFGHALIDELQSLKVSVEANWLEGTTMATISVLASRLLSSAEDFNVIQGSYKLLQAVRNTTFEWVQELSKADAPDEKSSRERKARVRDIAATCLGTYDVGPDNIAALLQSPQDLEILVYCSVTVMHNVPLDLHSLPSIPRLLLERNRRLSHLLETYFRRHVEDDQEGLDWAMVLLWPPYQRHTRWKVLESPNSRWLTCETAPSGNSSRQTIHLDMLTARLLVDGKPLTRLPDCFLQHPSYIALFGHQVFDVFPAKIPGLEFVYKVVIHGSQLESQYKNGHLLELIPPGKLELDIPALLVKDHVHWLNLDTCAIEFRPKERMWEPSDKNWVLQFAEGGQSVAQRQQGQITLFDIRSHAFHMIANTLSPLENSQYLIVTRNADVVEVDLPRFGLSFFIDKDGELHSRNQRDMVVDEDQSTGTMLGLVNQLVLRPKDRQSYGGRRVIIPQGDVVVEPSGYHIQATIHTGSDHARRPYHCYTVDTELCRLTGNVGLTNKLYKVYLHAVCKAMCLLQSAAYFSFMKLDPFDCELLARIGSLTVERTWSTARGMSQEVHWQRGLSSYVQSCAFYHAARNIVQYAQKLQVLNETPVTVCPSFSSTRRVPPGTCLSASPSFYPSQSLSSEYIPRDVVHCSIDDQKAFDCACMPCTALYEVFVQWSKVSGKTRDISLQYDREWLKPDLAERWITAVEICRRADRETHTFQLAFTLSAMAYSSPENVGLVATMFAFAAILESPEASWSIYDNESYRDFNSRQQRHFQSECLREQEAAVSILLDCWPCYSVPTRALECLSDSRYDKFNLSTALEKRYLNCFRNRCLKAYLDRVQNVLDEVRRTFMPSIRQSYAFTLSNSDVISVTTAVLTEHLLRKPPPVIKLLPDPLKQSHVLLSNKSSTGGLGSSPLEDVISTLLRCRLDQFGVRYAEHLKDSRVDLENEQSPIAPDPTRWTMWCNRLYKNAFRRLEEHLAPAGLVEESLFNSGQWPRITVTFLLGLLASTSRRLLRLKLAAGADDAEFLKELVNDGCRGVDGTQKYLDWLLIQAENRFLIRPMQASVAMEMISPRSGDNTALQLHMGEGKSSVIVPICCAALADRSNLAVQMFQLLVERVGGLTNRRIFYLPFSQCKAVGGILVTQPDHILSFRLMTVEQQLPPANVVGRSSKELATPLLNTQRWLDMHTRDILDESDELLHVRFQLVYTMGDQQRLEGYPDRWTTTQQVMTLVAKHSRFRVLDLICDDILADRLPNFAFEHVPSHMKDSIREYLTLSTISPQLLHDVRNYCAGSSLWNGLLLIRGLLAHGVLIYTLKDRRWRVDYGLDPQRTMLAVPYRAKDCPSSRAEFGHPDIAVALTCLSYYYEGLTEKQLWIKSSDLEVPVNLRHLSAINMESTEQFVTYLVPLFRHNKAVVDFFLAQFVFPKEAKEFPHKLSCSAWDLAERKSSGLPTTGFSGTNDFRYLLPTTIAQHALDHQRSTNARVLSHLLQQENDRYYLLAASGGAEELLKVIAKQSPKIRVLLDVGAQVLDLQNDEVAKRWLDINRDAQAAIYFNRHDELVVRTRDHVIEPFSASSFAQQLDQCVLYLDDEHTRGTDVKLPRGFCAAVTLGPKVTKDRLVQGCMRMRKLGHGHSVMFFAPPEVDRSIREVNNLKGRGGGIHVSDILVWAMTETCSDIQTRAPQWLQHGMDYKSRHSAWSSFLSDHTSPTELARSWLQPEAKRLEELYAPAPTDNNALQTSLDEELLERCSSLGLGNLLDNRLDEEQEREMVHEIEREYEVERPPPVPAAPHSIDEDVRYFIQTGCIPSGSRAFTAIFDTLTTTSAAFSGPQPWSRDAFFASRDFATTVLTAEQTDSYIRPVNWILSSTASGAQVLVIVSPFEVNVLLPDIRASKRVHLHAYTPRIIEMMKSCDDLRLYTIPSLPARWMPQDTLIRQLNVFAGQLYFPHKQAYVKLCRLLGIYTADLEDQGAFEIQSDGFIRPEHRPPAADCLNTFQQSPIPMLKALFGIRRKGMGYLPTHVGKLLGARRLTPKDFKKIA